MRHGEVAVHEVALSLLGGWRERLRRRRSRTFGLPFAACGRRESSSKQIPPTRLRKGRRLDAHVEEALFNLSLNGNAVIWLQISFCEANIHLLMVAEILHS